MKKINKGFKSSSCKDKNCLGCSTEPPTVSQHVIRDLGKTFCNINPEELTDEKLNAKPKVTKKKNAKAAGGKKKPDGDDAGGKKKPDGDDKSQPQI